MDKELVYLVQTDTTVGFSSSNDEKLSDIKQRPKSQKILQTVDSFKTLKSMTRVPKNFRKRVRKSNKSTFIYPNLKSFRIISKDDSFYPFITKFKNLYSTSANLTKEKFDYEFAYENSDVMVFTKDGFHENTSSTMYKINKKKIVKIR
ncbi:Sua5 YciO YrdC YwlC family protein [Arcobacter sp. LA11]|uniref:Sua5 YciO YrdC YwlC family protein n=1 Tax=Arcobacter sp. LA11 TaxID=1898176 RepID=UPI000934CF5A|nr:Sua5 YciO YrdC YwlC family protein [Arcobacter sp. LA11]